MEDMTTIQISKANQSILSMKKKHPRQSYDEVLTDILDKIPDENP